MNTPVLESSDAAPHQSPVIPARLPASPQTTPALATSAPTARPRTSTIRLSRIDPRRSPADEGLLEQVVRNGRLQFHAGKQRIERRRDNLSCSERRRSHEHDLVPQRPFGHFAAQDVCRRQVRKRSLLPAVTHQQVALSVERHGAFADGQRRGIRRSRPGASCHARRSLPRPRPGPARDTRGRRARPPAARVGECRRNPERRSGSPKRPRPAQASAGCTRRLSRESTARRRFPLGDARRPRPTGCSTQAAWRGARLVRR